METGLVSIDRPVLEHDSRKDNKKKALLKFLNNPDQIFGTTLFGNNISLVIVSSLTVYLIDYLSAHNFIVINKSTGSLILSGLLLVFAEIVPKAIYSEASNKLVPRHFPFLKFFYFLFKPFVIAVGKYNQLISHLFKLKEKNYSFVTHEDLSFLLSQTKDEIFAKSQKNMLEEALEFSKLTAENVMIHRTEIVAFEKNTPVNEIIEIAEKEGYTRFPVYEEHLDNITGILIIYDILKYENREKLTAGDLTRQSYFAPETIKVNKLLTKMQTQKISMAIVVDSFGGTAGLVTIEDILEEIVGEIEDEYDNPSTINVKKIGKNTYEVQGYTEVDFLNDEYDMNLPIADYETIAGLIIDKYERIPPAGKKLIIADWQIEIIQTTDKKIEKVKISKISKKQ